MNAPFVWWMQTCLAASARWDAWRARWAAREEQQANKDRLSKWWTEPRMHGVENTGKDATPEALAEIAPHIDVPKQTRRHAKPGGAS